MVVSSERRFSTLDKSDGEILKIRRIELGLTQQQVADIASINIRQYQRFESGERELGNASFRIGVAIADILKLDVHELVNTPSVDELIKNREAFQKYKTENGGN